ncbi:hypothetical protein ACHAPT_002777 [Fusarium lateritium]
MKNSKKKGGSSASRIADARFADFETDPRFRLPSKKQTKTTIDKRFAHMLTDNEFTATAKVDRYGRKVKSDSKKKALQRLYRQEDEEEDEEEKEQEDIELEDDEVVQKELRKAQENYDPARGGGFSSSESDSDSDDDESDSDEEGGARVDTEGDMQRFQDEQNEVEAGEVTNRIAIVNLDWDHVKSTDLMALFSSFLPESGGSIDKISVYPSEFGKERMQQEEVEGPPKALFKDSKGGNDSDEDSDEDSDDESEDGDEKIKKALLQEGDDQDFDSDALRSYQLDRLRYYYAVMICSSPSVAQKLYEAVDGREYQSSSNFLDLRFVPDDVTFDDEPRDECDKLPKTYTPIEFVTNALQSSKVKLTWDMHPEEASRKESINRAFTGKRGEIEENDLRAYLASDSEDEDEDDVEVVDAAAEEEDEAAEDEPKLSKKELARRKMRAALGLSEESTKSSKSGPVGDMEITFTPALTEAAPKKDAAEETTIEKYKRKERERKEKKREKARAKREGRDPDEEEDEEVVEAPEAETDDLGFDDPFFTTAEDPAAVSKTSIRKEERLKKRQAREAAEAESKAQKTQLQKVMAEDADDNQVAHLDHFDMNEIIRAEKNKKKKGKAKKRAEAKESRGGLQEDFKMDVTDDRFKAVFESHEYAIDPSNPKFKATEGMQKLLEESRKKRRVADEGGEEPRSKKAKKGRR